MNWKRKVGDPMPSKATAAPKPKCETADRIAAWLKVLCVGSAVEMRATKVRRHGTDALHAERALYPTTPEGLARMARDARELSPRAEAVYFTLNPVRPDLDGYATDLDVERRAWILIDVDPIRSAHTSSTEVEKAAAYEVAQRIMGDLHCLGWVDGVLADSGNGWHLLYRVDLPPNSTTVPRILKALAAKYDTEAVKVDQVVGNASRIVKLYGTLVRKGDHTVERPHRTSYVSVLVPDPTPVSPDALAIVESWLAPDPVAEPAVEPKPTRTRASLAPTKAGESRWKRKVVADVEPIEAHALVALRSETAKMASTATGGRNKQLIASACALSELANAGSLDWPTCEAELTAAAKVAGLDDQEINRTLASARRRTAGKSRDLSHVGTKKTPAKKAKSVVEPTTGLIEPIDDERRLARIFLEERLTHDDGFMLAYWNGNWHNWIHGAWRTVPPSDVASSLDMVVKRDFERFAIDHKVEILPFGTRLKASVLSSLQTLVYMPTHVVPDQPCWLDGDGPNPKECLNLENGILHLPTLVDEGPEKALTQPTPRYFAPAVLPYEFDVNAPKPTVLLSFLDSIWGHDPESIEALQQWFGYLLTLDTSLQSMLMVVGPPRSGKGTILRLIVRMLGGKANTTAPTLTSIGTQFGCETLIGKSLAYFGETRITGRADTQAIVERLLSISGEDEQSIPRKHTTDWQGRLTTRFVMLANEAPRLGDVSNALVSRLVILKLTKSFEGKEDRDLEKKLIPEIPGILLWAIRGWAKLRETRTFIRPASAAEEIRTMRQTNNPVEAFIEECITVDKNSMVSKGELFETWQGWCKKHGRDKVGDSFGFYRHLYTFFRNKGVELTECRPRYGGKLVRTLAGIKLTEGNDFADPVDGE